MPPLPNDVTEIIYDFARLPIRPGLKRRLWRGVHAELQCLPWSWTPQYGLGALDLRRCLYDTSELALHAVADGASIKVLRRRRSLAVARVVGEFTG